MLKLGVFNLKGGTAKSTTVLNLGASLVTSKRRVLLLDFDSQRSLSFALEQDGQTPTVKHWLEQPATRPRQTNKKNLHLIPGDPQLFQFNLASDSFLQAITKLEGYQIGLMDCAPGFNRVSLQAIMNCDHLLIPVICEPAVLKGVSETMQWIRQARKTLPISLVRVRHRSRLAMTQACEKLLIDAASDWNYRLLKTTIPENIAVAEAIAHHQPVTAYAPRSVAANAYKQLAKECLGVWKCPQKSSVI